MKKKETEKLKRIFLNEDYNDTLNENTYVKRWVIRNLFKFDNCLVGRTPNVNVDVLESELRDLDLNIKIKDTGEYYILYNE